MSRLASVSFALVLLLVLAVPAEATCFRCRDLTCFMAEGTKGWCRPVGTSGCFSGGSCSGSWEDCGTMGAPPCDIERLLPDPTEEREAQCAANDRPRPEYVVDEVIVLRIRPRVLVAAVAP